MKRLEALVTAAREQPLLDKAEMLALLAQGRSLAHRANTLSVEDGRYGGNASEHLGGGIDFAEHRHYLPGDDPRRIDWRITARTGQTHIRRYHEDRAPDSVFLVDRRASMRFATRGYLKVTQAVRLALLLIAYHTARQAQVSIFTLDKRLHRHGPQSRQGLIPLGQHLAAPCPPNSEAGPSITEALTQIRQRCAHGSRLILLSDFADATELSKAQWHQMARQYPMQLIRIFDPVEIIPPDNANACLTWHTSENSQCHAITQKLQTHIRQTAHDRTEKLRSICQQTGIAWHELQTDETDLNPLFLRLL